MRMAVLPSMFERRVMTDDHPSQASFLRRYRQQRKLAASLIASCSAQGPNTDKDLIGFLRRAVADYELLIARHEAGQFGGS